MSAGKGCGLNMLVGMAVLAERLAAEIDAFAEREPAKRRDMARQMVLTLLCQARMQRHTAVLLAANLPVEQP